MGALTFLLFLFLNPFFTQGQFWPSGIVIACVSLCVNHGLVCRITHHEFKLESSNLDKKMQNILLKVPIVFGADWAWPSRWNLTLFKNYVYLHRFCIFEIIVRHVCRTVPHPTWLCTCSLIPACKPTGLRHRLWNSLAVYLGETIGVQPASTLRLALDFYASAFRHRRQYVFRSSVRPSVWSLK